MITIIQSTDPEWPSKKEGSNWDTWVLLRTGNIIYFWDRLWVGEDGNNRNQVRRGMDGEIVGREDWISGQLGITWKSSAVESS